MKTSLILLGTAWLSCTAPSMAAPVLREIVVEPGQSLLHNGDFEAQSGETLTAWRAARNGFQIEASAGRGGSRALVCRSEGDGWFGASQTISLNQSTARPLVIQGWSKSEGVTGGSDRDYSLYADLTYTDGTPLWGQVANFRAGTHDWQHRRLIILPEKPVRTLTLHCLFRNHGGTVWFDDVVVHEVSSGDGMLFQGAAVAPVEVQRAERAGPARTLASGDGLELVVRQHAVETIRVGEAEFRDAFAAGFMVRDAAAESGFYQFENGACPELDLKISTDERSASDHVAIQGRISDTTARDRAITLVFALPVGGPGWNWGDDIRRVRKISGVEEFGHHVAVPCGATGTQSLYPIAPVWNDTTGVAIGLDMARPTVFRLGFHAGLNRLFAALDFGLANDTTRFPGSADFGFVLFRFEAAKGFRGAWQKYMEIFPQHFTVRSKEQGIWMPFTDVSRVPGWIDFGFKYHEGNNNVPWDDEHGVLSFRYTEPMTWWMPMEKDVPRVLSEALRVRGALAESSNTNRRRMAQVTQLAAMHDDAGEPALLFRNTPWANGAVWSLNPNPMLGLPDSNSARANASPFNAATVHWNPEVKERLYGPAARGSLDGEYLDSLEGYVTSDLNFRREHFRNTTVPLAFTQETKELVLFKGLAIFEFTRWMSEDVHRMGKLMFANSVPYRFTYLCPWLDIMGTETDWLRNGKYQPAPFETMDLWRSMAGAKPYLLLMNTDYDQFTSDLVEKYFNRTLFYGIWPSFFSHNASENPYWLNPRWFERDRPLFRKFIPLIKRVAEAGWRPVPNATCANQRIMIERFGGENSDVYLTLFNPTTESQAGPVSVDFKALGLRNTATPKAVLGAEPDRTGRGWHVVVPPEQTAVWQFVRTNN